MTLLTFYVAAYLAIGGLLFVVMMLDGNNESIKAFDRPIKTIFGAMVLCSFFWPAIVIYGLLVIYVELRK